MEVSFHWVNEGSHGSSVVFLHFPQYFWSQWCEAYLFRLLWRIFCKDLKVQWKKWKATKCVSKYHKYLLPSEIVRKDPLTEAGCRPAALLVTLSSYLMTMGVGHWVTGRDEDGEDATDNDDLVHNLVVTLQPHISLVHKYLDTKNTSACVLPCWSRLDLAWITLLSTQPRWLTRPLGSHTPTTITHPVSGLSNMPHIQMSKVIISHLTATR